MFSSSFPAYLPNKIIKYTEELNVLEQNECGNNENDSAKRTVFMSIHWLHLPLPGYNTKKISAADLGLHKLRDYALLILTAPLLTAWQTPQL